ncbi:MAG: LysM peptidoglycan-binding domain-containing protein [Elusimicrobiota bacterium]
MRPGDTLWSISHAVLKDPAKWDEILKYNKLPTSDPTVALPGMTLRVPVRLIKVSLRAAHVVFLVNQVLTRRKDRADWKNAKESMEVFRGDSLRTLEDSKARVRFLNKDILSLDQNSMAVIKPSADPDADVELKAGSVFAGHARVVTATARVTPRTGDTRYSASVDANLATKVEVFAGAAAVAAQGREVVVPAGMQTSVFPGLSPEPPKALDMPAELEARAQEYASAAANGGGVAAQPRVPPPTPEPEADAESLRGDIRVLKIGQPIQGYHVSVSKDREFHTILFEKRYEADEKFSAAATALAPGTYWWRVAPIDLLGTEGRARDARYYSLGLKPPDPENERLANMLQLSSPEENAEVGDTVRVAGILLDERLSLEVNGTAIKPDEEGNFSVVLKTQFGGNAVHLTITDGKGNQTHLSRHVTRL